MKSISPKDRKGRGFFLMMVMILPILESFVNIVSAQPYSATIPQMRIANFTAESWAGKAVFKDESSGNGDNTSISITNTGFDHARFVYHLPNVSYPNDILKVTVDIKGENIVHENGGQLGASLSDGSWYSSIRNTAGTYDWRKVHFVFKNDGSYKLWLQLGAFGNLVKGKVYFDNLEINCFTGKQFSSGKIRLNMDNEDVIIMDSKVQSFVNTLGEVYNSYQELTGYTPYNGSIIDIIFCNYHDRYGLAGNPITIDKRFTKDILKQFNTNNDYDFGVLHEIGHVFDLDWWNFNGEFWANTKMTYVLEQLNLSVNIGGLIRTGDEIKNYYKMSYDNELMQGNWSHDGLTYIFLQIKDKYGWGIFKEAFRNTQPVVSCKFEYFIYLLEKASGANIRQEFFTNEIWQMAINENSCT